LPYEGSKFLKNKIFKQICEMLEKQGNINNLVKTVHEEYIKDNALLVELIF
jgi:hypothetical protein